MPGPALDHTYRYPFASTLDRASPGRSHLSLAASHPELGPARFFEGRLASPKRTADALLALARVARTRFHVPPAMLAKILAAADPVVTCHDDTLRFEAFSACNGVYARFDLAGFEPSFLRAGTTNVDFHGEMRALLARIAATDALRLEVGREGIALASDAATVREKKVPLALRWLRGFGTSQALASRMKPVLDVSGVEARRFLRALPKQQTRGPSWVVRSGAGLRVSQRAAPGAVQVGGMERLAVLEDAAADAKSLVAYGEPGGASAWQLTWSDARFTLLLSPERWRGLSGEGALLHDLAREDSHSGAVARVRAALKNQSALDVDALARDASLARDAVDFSLATLATSGLVGFDLASQRYFHRALPFRYDLLEATHPRLVDARALLDEGAVALQPGEPVSALVKASGGEGQHRVRTDGETWVCTCPWFGKHAGERGPCKHVLATQLLLDANETEGEER